MGKTLFPMSSQTSPAAGRMNSIGSESRMLSSDMFLAVFGKIVRFSVCFYTRLISLVHSVYCACLATKANTVSMRDFSCEDLESQDAPQAKQGPISYSPQSGFEFEHIEAMRSLIVQLAERGNIPIDDNLMIEIEGLFALLITLQGCIDFKSTSAAIILYVRKYFDTSLTSQVIHYLSETFEPQSGGEAPDHPTWIKLIRSCRDDWALCKGNKLFSHFSKLLGLLVTFGLCKASSLTLSINEFKVFEPDLKLIHMNATDLADAAFGTVTFFVESMYMCVKQRSLRPFLLGDHSAVELDEEFSRIMSWWDLVKTGNLMRVQNISEHEFDQRLETLTTRLRNLIGGKHSFEKKILQDKFNKLLLIRNDYTTMKISSGVRRAPFVLELFGESSQGKTTLGDQLVDALLTSASLPTGKEFRASYNPSDKFMSNWSTDKQVMFIDDMANDKADFVERPPTRVIIDVCNNQPYYANMAELEKKGKVFVEPSVVIVNTNVKNLDARVYSNCPYSIQRRMHVVITVRAKREFQYIVDGIPQGIDSEKIQSFYERNGIQPTFDDIWTLTFEKAQKPKDLKEVAKYTPLIHNGKPLQNIDFRTAVQYLITRFHDHRKEQDAIVERMTHRTNEIELCGIDGCKQICGYCDDHDHLCQQFGEETANGFDKACSLISKKFSKEVGTFGKAVDGAGSLALVMSAKYFLKRWNWIMLLPTPAIMDDSCLKFMAFINKDRLKMRYAIYSLSMWALAFSFLWVNTVFAAFMMCVFLYVQKIMFKLVMAQFRRKLLKANSIAPSIQAIRDEYSGHVLKAAGVLTALYMMAKIYRKWVSFGQQGSLEPVTQEDVDKRDSEVNPWSQIAIRPVPIESAERCSSFDQVKSVVEKNLVYGSVTINDDRILMVNGLFVCSNVVVIPSHYFEKDVLDVTFRKVNPDHLGGKFATRLAKSCSYLVPGTDLCICYSSTGGSFKDLTRHFPLDNFPFHEFGMLWRSKEGVLKEIRGVGRPGMTNNGGEPFLGGTYGNLEENTFNGLCGATLISKGKVSSITGFHLGGREGTPRGCYGFLSRNQLIEGIEFIRNLDGILVTGSAEKFEKQVLGVNLLTGKPLHEKSPLRYLPQNSQLEYLGSCPGQTTPQSSVCVLPISEYVTDVTGQPNIWGPPKMNPQWYGWQTCLENMSNPALPYEYPLLEIAIKDFKSTLIPLFQNPLWNDCSPLSDYDNINGIDGKRFMDAIKLNTSVGFPLSGCKRRFVDELEPSEGQSKHRVFQPEIMEEIKRCEDCYRRGERAYTIAKACKKDEVLAKEKCRIFYGNPIALTFLVRKYYLPLLRVLQCNPLKTECAVGINSEGPEWEEFQNYVLKHGKDRIIGGDYGKYDQKLPSQLTIAALRILIDCARECDYTSEDLKIMEAMAGDIVFALIAFNGDLVGLTEGTHISGNSLTVILNGICGSLNLRCFFYSVYPCDNFENRMKFRDYVALSTYGDDNIGSVSSDIDNFTIKGISEFLAKYGQVYTMPDKTSELLEFLPYEDFEFLKRKNVYQDALNVHTGALLESSIFKSLHCHLRDKKADQTEEMLSALNIDDALRKWFHHGRDVFEQRRLQMKDVAQLSGITHLCCELDVDYDERVSNWKTKYVEGFEPQSGTERNLYQRAEEDIPMALIVRDHPIIAMFVGEIDLVYEKLVKGVHHVLIIEIKETTGSVITARVARNKARKQIRRVLSGLVLINQNLSYMGMILTPKGYEKVLVKGQEGFWEDINLPL